MRRIELELLRRTHFAILSLLRLDPVWQVRPQGGVAMPLGSAGINVRKAAPYAGKDRGPLQQSTNSTLPDFSSPVNALAIKVTVPLRLDPVDPAVASRTTILGFIDDLPVNSKIKVFLSSKVPDPVQRFSPPSTGFSWGLSPLFDPLDPKGFGVKGNARYAIRISDGLLGRPNIVFAAWGDGQMFLNFEAKDGKTKPRIEGQGQVFLGFGGTF